MYNEQDFIEAINNYIDIKGYPDGGDIFDIRSYCRGDLILLRNSFKTYYGFDLLEMELYIMWQWHSTEWCASWLIIDSVDIQFKFFDEFVERYKNGNN